LFAWKGATFAGNTIYSDQYLIFAGALQPDTYKWDGNTFYMGSSIFGELNNGGLLFPTWQTATGLDMHSTLVSHAPTDTWVFVRPNSYERGRGNITVYNWSRANTVAADVSKVLALGSQYQVLNAQDFFADPVVSGTYEGGTISIPITGLSVAAPLGGVPIQPTVTGPLFGAFIIVSTSAKVLPEPPTNLTATVE
jgi:hypothetical protein